eukprot:8794930-Pyramimonas_sp.AAC.1
MVHVAWQNDKPRHGMFNTLGCPAGMRVPALARVHLVQLTCEWKWVSQYCLLQGLSKDLRWYVRVFEV